MKITRDSDNPDVFHIEIKLELSREQLGRWVREGWVKWASTLPNVKYDWIKPYEELTPSMQEADNIIGEYLLEKILDAIKD